MPARMTGRHASKRSQSAEAARKFYRNDRQADFYATNRFAGRRRGTDRRDKRALDRALRSIDVSGEVLDCPCGTGRITEVLMRHGLKVRGIDVSLEMARHAAHANRDGLYVQGDILALPFADGAFDAVVSMRFIYHLGTREERIKALSEMARVSRRYLIVSFFDSRTLQSARKRLKHLIGGRRTLRIAQSRCELTAEAREAGWSIRGFFPTLWGVAQNTMAVLEKTSGTVNGRKGLAA